MEEGRILAADHHGAYVLKLVGDVRVNLCSAIDDYFEEMFENPEFSNVLVDLCEAEGIDSTTLGLLAKLALRYRGRFHHRPTIYSSKPGINRLLASMAFGKIFDIHEEPYRDPEDVHELPVTPIGDDEARDKVLEAHRVLMDMSSENRERFRDLVKVLEQS